MQPMLKRLTIPALVVLVTLFTGGVALSDLRSPAPTLASDSSALTEQPFPQRPLGRSAAGVETAQARSTPSPVQGEAPALQAVGTFTVAVQGSNSFFRQTITIAPGDTVQWQRTGGFHNVVADDGSFRLGEGDSGSPGSSWRTGSHTFNTAGTFRYFCEIHGGPGGQGMSGIVIVQDAVATQTPTATSPAPTATATPEAPGKVYMPVISTS
jgi:plastocyanin